MLVDVCDVHLNNAKACYMIDMFCIHDATLRPNKINFLEGRKKYRWTFFFFLKAGATHLLTDFVGEISRPASRQIPLL